MGMWNWLTGLFDHGSGIAGDWLLPHADINPATGLPMVGGIGGVDAADNPFGTNHDHWHSHDGFPDRSPDGVGFDSW